MIERGSFFQMNAKLIVSILMGDLGVGFMMVRQVLMYKKLVVDRSRWGCMTFYGCRLLMKINGKVNQTLYLEIFLEVDLSSTICFYDMDPRRVIFQQDNAPIHNAKSMKQWFKQQNFGLLQWLAQSSDLNPIEHMRALVKRRLN